ncbi:ImmA/IrrE family metallo-endopeptidase [Pseudactinotalea sp. Z1739]|uniref:ImmA/IrrE family metallo-endopeptidase n=1 Tax=Pseudactinotalea sp. Z1739 TaxID=3413028 RepID=UPI003C7E9BE3
MKPTIEENTDAARLTSPPARPLDSVPNLTRHPLRRLRSLVPEQPYPFSWVAAQRIASAQARLLRDLASRKQQDPVEFVKAIATIEVRMDDDLPQLSSHYWDAGARRWIITIRTGFPKPGIRFLILREFKRILDYPVGPSLYDARQERGSVQADMAGDHFTLNVLMPARAVREAISNGITTIKGLARHFDVLDYAVILRLSDLGLLPNITD